MVHKGLFDSKAIKTQVGKSACGCEFLCAVLEATYVYTGMYGCSWVCVCRGDACMQVQEKTFPFLLTSHVFDSVDETGCCGVMET